MLPNRFAKSILILLPLLSCQAFAQDSGHLSASHGFWIAPMAGFIRPALGLGFNLAFATPRHSLITFRYLSSGEIFSSNNFDTHAEEGALLFGMIRSLPGGFATGSIGISSVSGLGHGNYLGMGKRCGWFDSDCKDEPQYEENQFETIGIPVQVQCVATGKFVGFGLSFDVDLNREMPQYGVTITIPFGVFPR
jgi:hypothetical protein